MRAVLGMILAGMVILSGCKTFKSEKEPAMPLVLSGTFAAGQGSAGESKRIFADSADPWWHILGSGELNRLIANSLAHNFDLKTLQARLAQAEANIAKADAAFFPGLNFSMGGQRKGTQVKRSTGSGSTYDGSHSWDASLSGSYTPDMWNEAGADRASRVMLHQAVSQDYSAAALDLTANIADAWVDIIAARNKQEILARQIRTNKTLLELLKLRFANGRASALEVSQQQESLAGAKAQVPLLEKQEKLLLNALALLSGSTSAGTVQVEDRKIPDAFALPQVGIPSDLLASRPDIRAAQMRLSSARWDKKAAQADLMPSFNITAQALFSSGQLDLLFHNWVTSLAASIAGPLFEGGLRRAEVRRTEAAAREQANQYAAVVARAVFEVEDRLTAIEKQDEYVGLLEEELAVARVALEDARVQYLNGQSSYLNYLITWGSIQRQERQLAGEQANAVKERIGLYRSLGWQKPFILEKPSDEES